MRSVESAMSGHRLLELGDQLEVARARVAAVHPREHAVRARLQRQVQVLDTPSARRGSRGSAGASGCTGFDVVKRMRSMPSIVVDPLEERGQIGRRSRGRARRRSRSGRAASPRGSPPPRGPRISSTIDLGRVAALPAARRRHDAERAVLLAALHHRDEGLEPPRRRRAGR